MIENFGSGAAQPNISGEEIESIRCIIPTDEVLRQFTVLCEPLISKLINLRMQCIKLRQMRDKLLPRLLSGKLSVNEIGKLENFQLSKFPV
jgi:type I restriction enzyme S subunit